MKYITFTVPCYNSAAYMERCVHTLLAGGKLVEIIIVDDGSGDCTGEIADNYAKAYPDIVRVIHQENGGHGAGVNAGLAAARGRYFKVVDSDDWLDMEALKKLLQWMCCQEASGTEPDLIICNYLYDHLYENKVKCMPYRNVFTSGKICGWEDIRPFGTSVFGNACALVQNRSAAAVRRTSAKTYILCGQPVCQPAAAVCKNALLPGFGSISLLFGQGGSVGQRKGFNESD